MLGVERDETGAITYPGSRTPDPSDLGRPPSGPGPRDDDLKGGTRVVAPYKTSMEVPLRGSSETFSVPPTPSPRRADEDCDTGRTTDRTEGMDRSHDQCG